MRQASGDTVVPATIRISLMATDLLQVTPDVQRQAADTLAAAFREAG